MCWGSRSPPHRWWVVPSPAHRACAQRREAEAGGVAAARWGPGAVLCAPTGRMEWNPGLPPPLPREGSSAGLLLPGWGDKDPTLPCPTPRTNPCCCGASWARWCSAPRPGRGWAGGSSCCCGVPPSPPLGRSLGLWWAVCVPWHSCLCRVRVSPGWGGSSAWEWPAGPLAGRQECARRGGGGGLLRCSP